MLEYCAISWHPYYPSRFKQGGKGGRKNLRMIGKECMSGREGWRETGCYLGCPALLHASPHSNSAYQNKTSTHPSASITPGDGGRAHRAPFSLMTYYRQKQHLKKEEPISSHPYLSIYRELIVTGGKEKIFLVV